MHPVYFDSAASTPLDPDVALEMCEALRSTQGNPSSAAHRFGQTAARRVEACRAGIAAEFGCAPDEIIFTSSATEANNLALAGVVRANAEHGHHAIVSAIEHRAVLACAEQLEREGFEVTRVQPDKVGVVQADAIAAQIRPDTLLISLMHTNNETGVQQPIEAVAEVAAEAGLLFHVDAAQGAGKFKIDLDAVPIDLLTVSAHKLYGPTGSGCLVVRNRRQLRLAPLIHGGGQEYGLRSGTLAVHQIVGLATALQKMAARRSEDLAQVSALRERFLANLKAALHPLLPLIVHGDPERCSPYIINFSIPGVSGHALINQCASQIAIATGSACASGTVEPSHVLRAMGVEGDLLYGAVRVSLDRYHTQADIETAVGAIMQSVKRIRELDD